MPEGPSVLTPQPPPNRSGASARVEDLALVTGHGLYVHDVSRSGMLHAVFVRSQHAHARVRALDITEAHAAPDVCAVFVAADFAAACLPPINPVLPPLAAIACPLLADEVVHSVGQPLALVVARSIAAAAHAALLVQVDYDTQPALPDLAHEAAPLLVSRHGQRAAPGEAPHALQVRVRHQQARVVAAALEARAVVAESDGMTITVWLPTQSPARARDDIARTLKLEAAQVRVIAPDVGGAFGAKASVYPEDLLVALAAHRLKAAVKWAASRTEEFTSATHGRGALLEGMLALDAGGRFLHLEARLAFPLGAWLPYSAAMPLRNAARILPGPYRVGSVDIEARGTQSNAAAMNIYRGAGRPEAALLMERLVDAAASLVGIDPVELRRRNLIPASAMPYRTPTGERFDSGDYLAALERACARFGYVEERAQQARRRAAGELVGIGVAMYVEPCGQGWESARLTLLPDGSARVASGSAAQGQGHQSTYAAIAASALGLDPQQVTVVHGDTALCPDGIGALASRSIAIGGSAVAAAAQAAATRRDAGEALPLTADTVYTAPGEAWSYGCVIARMSVSAETGLPRIERLVWVDDAGRIISPQLAAGQLHGGLAQGIGQAMLERIVYDHSGQLLTGSFLDYALPRAADMPPLEIESLCMPATANALGAKGVGEAGTIGVPAALLNAAIDALSPFNVAQLDFPLTAERLWRTINTSTREPSP